MLLHHLPDFHLQYDQALGLLRLEWAAGADTRTLRASAANLLVLARHQATRHLLLNMNTVPDLSTEDELWLGQHWMPGIVQLPLERLVLVIDSSQVHNQLAIEALHDLVLPHIRFDAQYFTDSKAALHWLTDDSPRLPALLAEWDAQHQPAAGSQPPHRPSLLAWPQPGRLAPAATGAARRDGTDQAAGS